MAAVIELRPPEPTAATVSSAQKWYLKGDYAQAGTVAEMYLREHPDDAQALCILSACYKQADRNILAYALAKRATELRDDRPEVWVTQGFAAQSLWKHDEALDCYRKALQRAEKPQQKGLYNNNIASVYLDLGEFTKAEEYVDKSLKYEPNEPNSRHNKGLCLLARREWGEAWNYYSASIGSNQRTEFRYMGKSNPEPRWDGKPFPGILAIFGEQGIGDEICAASATNDIVAAQKSAGGRVIIDCDKRLEGLFRRSFPEATVHGTRAEKTLPWPDADRDIGASIAGFETLKYFRTSAESFPGTPYLKPCPDRLSMWEKLFDNGKPTIGIAWTGGTFKNAGTFRNLPLTEWGPLFDAIDANWVSLQYKDASKEIEGTPVKQYKWATVTKDYDDTAALVASCDLVIGMQTSVCHLAGALGVPTWVLIPKTSQWRYGETYDDLPWYKSSRLFRQGATWPIQTLANELRAFK
jgi:tetratricopeptide (TPR) repeat protein